MQRQAETPYKWQDVNAQGKETGLLTLGIALNRHSWKPPERRLQGPQNFRLPGAQPGYPQPITDASQKDPSHQNLKSLSVKPKSRKAGMRSVPYRRISIKRIKTKGD